MEQKYVECLICGEQHPLIQHTLGEELQHLLAVRGTGRTPNDLMKLRIAFSALQQRLDKEMPEFAVTYVPELQHYVLCLKKWQV